MFGPELLLRGGDRLREGLRAVALRHVAERAREAVPLRVGELVGSERLHRFLGQRAEFVVGEIFQ